jgi:hypothetical protein
MIDVLLNVVVNDNDTNDNSDDKFEDPELTDVMAMGMSVSMMLEGESCNTCKMPKELPKPIIEPDFDVPLQSHNPSYPIPGQSTEQYRL